MHRRDSLSTDFLVTPASCSVSEGCFMRGNSIHSLSLLEVSQHKKILSLPRARWMPNLKPQPPSILGCFVSADRTAPASLRPCPVRGCVLHRRDLLHASSLLHKKKKGRLRQHASAAPPISRLGIRRRSGEGDGEGGDIMPAVVGGRGMASSSFVPPRCALRLRLLLPFRLLLLLLLLTNAFDVAEASSTSSRRRRRSPTTRRIGSNGMGGTGGGGGGTTKSTRQSKTTTRTTSSRVAYDVGWTIPSTGGIAATFRRYRMRCVRRRRRKWH